MNQKSTYRKDTNDFYKKGEYKMKRKEIYLSLLFMIILVATIAIPFKNVLATPFYSPIIKIVDYTDDFEYLNCENITNDAGTAKYDPDNNVLTLENYTGGPIEYLETNDLTIVLKGKNTINWIDTTEIEEYSLQDLYQDVYYGLKSENGNIKITGNGTLEINDALTGIDVSSSNLEINDTSITINRSQDKGINAQYATIINSNISINGNVRYLYR